MSTLEPVAMPENISTDMERTTETGGGGRKRRKSQAGGAAQSLNSRSASLLGVFALQIVPLQVALIPLLDIYVNKLGFGASYWSVWLSHTIFALPLATFLIHNFMRELPAELMEAARVDGAGHVTIFFKILLLSAGAFISMVVPVAVFLALQRFFVRGLLAGGLKG